MFVGEETFITSGISSIRNRIYYVCLGKSFSFLFHFTAVYCSELIAFWLLQHICPSTGSYEVTIFVILGRRAQYVQRIVCLVGLFLIVEVIQDCKLCIPTFSAFGIVHV